MANPEHLEILKRGVEEWNEWRGRNKETKPDLSVADLSPANFTRTNLNDANLNYANLSWANFYSANLRRAVTRAERGERLVELNLAVAHHHLRKEPANEGGIVQLLKYLGEDREVYVDFRVVPPIPAATRLPRFNDRLGKVQARLSLLVALSFRCSLEPFGHRC